MHTYIHSSANTCIHTYIHTYIHTSLHSTNVHTLHAILHSQGTRRDCACIFFPCEAVYDPQAHLHMCTFTLRVPPCVVVSEFVPVWDIPGVFKLMWGWLDLVDGGLFVAHEWHFRTGLDHMSALMGMAFAAVSPHLSLWLEAWEKKSISTVRLLHTGKYTDTNVVLVFTWHSRPHPCKLSYSDRLVHTHHTTPLPFSSRVPSHIRTHATPCLTPSLRLARQSASITMCVSSSVRVCVSTDTVPCTCLRK